MRAHAFDVAIEQRKMEDISTESVNVDRTDAGFGQHTVKPQGNSDLQLIQEEQNEKQVKQISKQEMSVGEDIKLEIVTNVVMSSSPTSFYSVTGTESLATCQRCNEIFDDPRLLTCLHSFCMKCIRDLINHGGTKLEIRCHVCKSTTEVPVGGIESIPPNLYLEHESIIARLEQRIVAPSLPDCEECSRDPVLKTLSFCCTCISFLCDKCHTQHVLSRKSHLHHRILLLDDTTNIKAKLRENLTFLPTTCPVHIRQEITFFCNDCELLICIQCALAKHPGHNLDDLQDFVTRQKNTFCEEVKDMPNIVGKLDDLMNSGRIVCENIKVRELSINESIGKVFAELHQALDTRKSVLQQQCTDIVTTKLDTLTVQIDGLAYLKESILTCNEFVTTSSESYDDSEFISVITSVQKRINSIKAKAKATPMSLSADDIIHFNSDATAVLSCIATMGSVFVVKHQNYSGLHDPINVIKTANAYHVAIHRNGDYIVANHVGDSIEIYDSKGTKRSSFGTNGTRPGQFKRPLGITVVGDNIYIAEFHGTRCQKMTTSGEFLCEIGAGKLSGAWGCAVSKNGVLYVAEETSNRVQAFTPDGKRLKILCSNPVVYAPRDVAIDKQGKIHVAACGSKAIKVFEPNGNFVREYGKGTVSEPSGVAVDQLGFCFAADWSGKCLHVFDQTGKHVNKVNFDGHISGVSIDDNNHVHVVNHSAQTISKY
jgi:hypothetical protein